MLSAQNNVTTFSGCGRILKADACEMRLYSQNMPNQLFCLCHLEHIEVFLVIFSETSETGHVGFPENWMI